MFWRHFFRLFVVKIYSQEEWISRHQTNFLRFHDPVNVFGHLGSDDSSFEFNFTKNTKNGKVWDPAWNSQVAKIFDFLRKKVEENQNNGLDEFPFENVGHIYHDTNKVMIYYDLWEENFWISEDFLLKIAGLVDIYFSGAQNSFT